ncbi:MAG: PAS domain-containing protein, partial [Bacteroidota bacterium]
IDNTEGGFILMDKALNIVSFNRQFETLYSKYFKLRVKKGDNILNYAQPERKVIVKQIYDRVLAGAHETSEIEVPDPEGGTRIFSLTYKPAVNQAGEIEGAFVSTLDFTETKRKEQQIKEHQSFIETAIENLPIGIAVNRTEDNATILMNKTFADIYGWPKEELIDVTRFFEKVYPDEHYRKKISARILDDVNSGDPKRMNWEGITITTKNGEERIINAKSIPVFDQNLMISTVIDVTERERNLQRIKDSERKLLTAQHMVKLGNWQLDLEKRTFDWSDEVYNIWGISKDSFTPTLDYFYTTIHPDDRTLFNAEKDAVIEGIKELDVEHRIMLPDGSVKWVHEKGTILKDAFGKNQTLEGSVQDITVEKLLSLSLEESNQRYHYVTQATFDAIWDWDIIKNTIYRGENYQFIFGYSKEELIASRDLWVDHIHIDERDIIAESITKALEGNQSKWSGEYKYEQHDGTFAYVIDRGIIVRDRNGKAIRMVGAMQDITKQKGEEARLKLLESVITNTNDSVLITEAEPLDEPGPRIIYVNEAFTRMTGYAPEEVIGKSPRILHGPQTDIQELKKLGEALRKWESYEITTINYKKNGDPFWINFAVTPVADATGWVTHWVAVERDVTKIKQAEQDLQKAYDDRLLYIQNIEEKNKRLGEIAWIQSHIVRAPLARIMGIVEVLTQFKADPEEFTQLMKYLNQSAEELDKIIRDIANKSAETRIYR